MKKKAFAEYITNFNFKDLFINLGWDNFNNKLAVAINDDAFQLSGIVEKKVLLFYIVRHLQTEKFL